MIKIKIIDAQHKADINLPNESFQIFGRVLVSYNDGKWDYQLQKFAKVSEMKFPDENYNYEKMKGSIFLGAYDGDECVGLAILQADFLKYMYLYDLKVNSKYRGQHIGQKLIAKAKDIAAQKGYSGLYTQCQDNNPGAFLFYIKTGFYIGGLDTGIYKHTKQEGKADLILYCEAKK